MSDLNELKLELNHLRDRCRERTEEKDRICDKHGDRLIYIEEEIVKNREELRIFKAEISGMMKTGGIILTILNITVGVILKLIK